jgi:hypothetical protein
MCLTCKAHYFWEVSEVDYPKFSARDQGATYPRVGSFLFQLQGGQTHIPSWWKRTWKMEGRIRTDQELFLQSEVNHLYHWYGLPLSFHHLSYTLASFLATLKGINLASLHVRCTHFVHGFRSCVMAFVLHHGSVNCPYLCWNIHTSFWQETNIHAIWFIIFNSTILLKYMPISSYERAPKNNSAYYEYYIHLSLL